MPPCISKGAFFTQNSKKLRAYVGIGLYLPIPPPPTAVPLPLQGRQSGKNNGSPFCKESRVFCMKL